MRKPRRHAAEHDLLEALDQAGCPVCRLAGEAVDALLQSICYEQVNDLELREQLRAEGGFCPEHARRFLAQPNGPLATAIVYRDVLVNAARRLDRAGPPRQDGGRPRNGVRSLLAGLLGERGRSDRPAHDAPRPCVACRARSEAEERHLTTLCARVTDAAVAARYRAADGLCLLHLARALEADDPGAGILARAALAGLTGLVDELDVYIRKHDYRFRPERWDGGEDVPARAVERAVGG